MGTTRYCRKHCLRMNQSRSKVIRSIWFWPTFHDPTWCFFLILTWCGSTSRIPFTTETQNLRYISLEHEGLDSVSREEIRSFKVHSVLSECKPLVAWDREHWAPTRSRRESTTSYVPYICAREIARSVCSRLTSHNRADHLQAHNSGPWRSA